MKKLFALCLVLCITGTALANGGNSPQTLALFKPRPYTAPQPVHSYFDTQIYRHSANDFYIGLDGGIQFSHITHEREKYTGTVLPVYYSTHPNGYGGHGGVYIGYSRRVGNFSFGTELYSFLGTAIHRDNVPGSGAKLTTSMQNLYGIDFVPSYYTSKFTKLYLQIGLAGTEFRASTNNPNHYNTNSFHKMILGLRTGIGVEAYFMPHVSVRFGYSMYWFQHIKHTYKSGANTTHNTIKPLSSSLDLGLTLHLNNNLYH